MLSNKSNPLSYMITNGNKDKKKNKKKTLIHFESVTRVSDLSDELQHTNLSRFFFRRLYLIPFFPRIVWIDKLYDLTRGFFSYKGCHGNKKNTFFQLSYQRLLRGNILHQKHDSYRYILPLKKK